MKHRRHNTYARFVAPSKFEYECDPFDLDDVPWWKDHERVRRMTEGRRVLECPPVNHISSLCSSKQKEFDHAHSSYVG